MKTYIRGAEDKLRAIKALRARGLPVGVAASLVRDAGEFPGSDGLLPYDERRLRDALIAEGLRLDSRPCGACHNVGEGCTAAYHQGDHALLGLPPGHAGPICGTSLRQTACGQDTMQAAGEAIRLPHDVDATQAREAGVTCPACLEDLQAPHHRDKA